MININNKSLVKLKSLEAVYFLKQALAATELLPSEVKSNENVSIFKSAVENMIASLRTESTVSRTNFLNTLRDKIDKDFNYIKLMVKAKKFSNDDEVQKAVAIAELIINSKYQRYEEENIFEKYTKLGLIATDLNDLDADTKNLLDIKETVDDMVETYKNHEELYNERNGYSQTVKGVKFEAKEEAKNTWYNLAYYVNAYNVIYEGSCDSYAKVINGLYVKASTLDLKSIEEAVGTDNPEDNTDAVTTKEEPVINQ